jgi:hypothetical protein
MTYPGVYYCHQKEGKTSKKMCGESKTWQKEKIYVLVQ